MTVVGMDLTSAGPGGGRTVFHADRPFLYLIRERSADAILFIGRMDSPGN